MLGLLVIAQLLMSTRFEEMAAGGPKPKPDIKGIVKDPVFRVTTLGLFLIILGLQ